MLERLGYGLSSFCTEEGGGGGPAYLDGVLSSTCCDLDATIAASYGGSGQTWANLIAAPADGESQSAYDFWLGADGTAGADDPTFSTDKFTFDGGDHFQIKGGNTALIEDMHDTAAGQSYWIAVSFNMGNTVGARNLFSTFHGSQNEPGISLYAASTTLRFAQCADGTATQRMGDITISASTDYLVIVTADPAGDNFQGWLNAATANMAQGGTGFDTDTAIAAKAALQIGSGDGLGKLQSGSTLRSVAFGNEYLDDTKAAAIIAHLEARHGVDYTP